MREDGCGGGRMKINNTIALFAALVVAALGFFVGTAALFLLGKPTGGTICALCMLGCVYGAAGLGGGGDI
jgi:hypothetical protein